MKSIILPSELNGASIVFNPAKLNKYKSTP